MALNKIGFQFFRVTKNKANQGEKMDNFYTYVDGKTVVPPPIVIPPSIEEHDKILELRGKLSPVALYTELVYHYGESKSKKKIEFLFNDVKE